MRRMYLHRNQLPKNVFMYWHQGCANTDTISIQRAGQSANTYFKNNSSKIFSCIRTRANTGPTCIRAKINSSRFFPAYIGFVPGGKFVPFDCRVSRPSLAIFDRKEITHLAMILGPRKSRDVAGERSKALPQPQRIARFWCTQLQSAYQRAPNPPESAQPRLSRVKARSSPAKGYKFGCVCSNMAGHEDAGVVTGHI